MATNTIEALTIKIGIDPQKVLETLNEIQNLLQGVQAKAENSSLSLVKGQNQLEDATAKAEVQTKKMANSQKDVGKTAVTATEQANLAYQKLNGNIKKIAGMIKKTMGPLIAMFGVKSMFSGFMGAEELGDLSKSVRMNVSDLDAWSKANEAAGGSSSEFLKSVKDYTEKTGQSGQAFLKLGERIRGMNKAQQEGFIKAQGLSKESVAIFTEQKGKAEELVSSFKQTAFTEKDAENARKLRIAWQGLGMTVKSISNQMLGPVIPILQKIMDKVKSATTFMAEHMQFLKIVVLGLGTALSVRFVKDFAVFTKALMTNPIVRMIAVVMLLAAVIDDLIFFTKGGGSAFEELLKKFGMSQKEIEEVRQGFKDFVKVVKDLWNAIKPVAKKLGAMFGRALQKSIKIIVGIVGSLAKGFAKLLENLPDIKKQWEDLKELFKNLFSGKDLRKSVLGIFSGLWKLIKLILLDPILTAAKNLFNFTVDELIPESWKNFDFASIFTFDIKKIFPDWLVKLMEDYSAGCAKAGTGAGGSVVQGDPNVDVTNTLDGNADKVVAMTPAQIAQALKDNPGMSIDEIQLEATQNIYVNGDLDKNALDKAGQKHGAQVQDSLTKALDDIKSKTQTGEMQGGG